MRLLNGSEHLCDHAAQGDRGHQLRGSALDDLNHPAQRFEQMSALGLAAIDGTAYRRAGSGGLPHNARPRTPLRCVPDRWVDDDAQNDGPERRSEAAQRPALRRR